MHDAAAPPGQLRQGVGERGQAVGRRLVSEQHELVVRALVPARRGAAHVLEHCMHSRVALVLRRTKFAIFAHTPSALCRRA